MVYRSNGDLDLIGYESGYEGVIAAAKQAREEKLDRRRRGLPDKPIQLASGGLPDDFNCVEIPMQDEINRRKAQVQAGWSPKEKKKRAGASAPLPVELKTSSLSEDDRLASSRRLVKRVGAD